MAAEHQRVEVQQEHELSDLEIYLYDRPKRVRAKKSYREYVSDEENSEMREMKKEEEDTSKRKRTKGFRRKEGNLHSAQEKKQQQLSVTLTWLGENYELKEGMCLPRCVMYTHYMDFCKKTKLCPSGPATFGKVIRQKFPKLTTRRLGTRGQSKYHYYGIRVQESSQYFHAGYSKQGLTRFSAMKLKGEGGASKKFALNTKARTLLPDFPNAKRLNLPKGVSQQKVETFIMMYRTHCQRLLDTVLSANFDGINTFILHFWQGMPSHMITVLQNAVVVDVIAICDSILYKVLIDVLIPSSIQDLPDSLREEIREFANNVQVWLRTSLSDVPPTVREAKLKVAEKFSSALKRQVSFVHLAQTARSVLLSYDSVSRMIGDLRKIDFSLIMSKALFLMGNSDIPSKTKTFVNEFDGLLSKQAPLEAYTEWLDTIVDRCVLKDLDGDNDNMFEKRANKFLVLWSFVTSKILEDLTLRSAPSFGVFHLIHATFQEYILLIVENQKMHVADKQLQTALQRHLKDEFVEDSIGHWVDVDYTESGTRLPNHSIDDMMTADTTAKITNNNNNNDDDVRNKTIHNKNTNKPTNKKQKPNSKPTKAQDVIKTAYRPIFISNSYTPDSIRQAGISIQVSSMTTNLPATTNTSKQMPSQHSLQPSVANVTANDVPGRAMHQYMYTDEMSRRATQASDMTGYHNQELINTFDKGFFNTNVAIPNSEYLDSPWIQPDNQSLTILNNVTYDLAAPTAGNVEMNYHRTADFGFNYTNDMGIANNGIHPFEIPTPMNHRSDIAYNEQGKEVDYSNYQNAITRYNSLYYDNMRTNGQTITPDLITYPMAPNTGTPIDIDGMMAHEAQMSRMGIGAV